jgi:hypothetical protein
VKPFDNVCKAFRSIPGNHFSFLPVLSSLLHWLPQHSLIVVRLERFLDAFLIRAVTGPRILRIVQIHDIVLLCIRALAFFEPSVDKSNACSNLCEEYSEYFELIFLLPFMFPNTLSSVTSHSIKHTFDIFATCRREVAHSADRWRSHGHYENIPLVNLRFIHCCITIRFFEHS